MKAQGTVELALGSSKDLSFNGPALSNPMPPISSFLEKTVGDLALFSLAERCST